MGVYIYNADIYCDECGAGLCDDLDAKGVADTEDSGDYPQHEADEGEVDTPSHCGACHKPLGARLTPDGVAYVIENVESRLRAGVASRKAWIWPDGFYKGLDGNAVLRDWCELALPHLGGDDRRRDKRMLELFLHWTRPEHEAA